VNASELSSLLGPPAEPTSAGITVDVEGNWYYMGNMMTREDILELFLGHLEETPGGQFRIALQGRVCPIGVSDTPFVISRVDRQRLTDPHQEAILVHLKHQSVAEVLDPSTLYVGRENVLYCAVRAGSFRARFSRPAYYQIAEWIAQDDDSESFYLELNGTRHPISTTEFSR
jgi:uncharacterized protein